ncbi:M1 family metallopeptidase [Acidobacteriota bacterium]
MTRKTSALIVLFVLVFCITSAASEEPLCKQIANYTMDVRLNAENKTISGKEILKWTNDSNIPIDELWFHLYWNAFQNNMSDFLIEGTARWEKNYRKNEKDDWGYIRLDDIRLVDEAISEEFDLTPTMIFRHPDNANLSDQTVISVKLPQPVEPGEAIVLHIDFHSKVPKPIHRTGVYRDSYFIAQWFPKIGVFTGGKWNCHQFHATTNFFADYGTYDVKITLPSRFVIGATGEHREKKDNNDGTTTHRFVQHSVHDFAWTASPHYLEYKEIFQFAPGKATEVILLLQPYHKSQKNRYMDATKFAIKYCSLWYGDYPYSSVTCVDPAYNSRCGGMEYPTLFTGGTYFLSRKRIPRPEGVTIHEFGHGYFFGLIGSNEFEDAWLDEGFTSFLDSEVYHAAYGDPVYSRHYFGIPVTFKTAAIPIELNGLSSHRQTHNMDKMQNFTWDFLNTASYFSNSYAKAELMLRTLQNYMGKDIFSRMIKAYSTRNWFKHPKPQDFYNIVSEFAGKDMTWLLDQFVFGSGSLDYAVEAISSQNKRIPKGWMGTKYREDGTPYKKSIEYRSEVLVRRVGEVRIPVDVSIVFEDGSEIREAWDGQYRWKKYIYEGPLRLKRALVDPDHKLVIDLDRTNNSKVMKPNKLAPLKWVSNWLVWLQHALETLAFLGS